MREEREEKIQGAATVRLNREIIILLMAFEIRFPLSTKGVLYFAAQSLHCM